MLAARNVAIRDRGQNRYFRLVYVFTVGLAMDCSCLYMGGCTAVVQFTLAPSLHVFLLPLLFPSQPKHQIHTQ